ncbi:MULTISPECIES: hypothetical protein [Methylosinus]|nr:MULTISPECIES: hypothetical protein [Methylosinus]
MATRAASPSSIVKRFSYSPIGNLLSKTDVGAYYKSENTVMGTRPRTQDS